MKLYKFYIYFFVIAFYYIFYLKKNIYIYILKYRKEEITE